ncbi:Hypothetical protein SCF082_LOCUS3935 [Durusdinium trenchii]|uniref:Uncharacterized protein n=1 Tax=Durusdinium trenchii TaxID=1381693 RepID=A0ABP0HY73_9DINO
MSTSIVVAEKGLPRRTQRTEEGTGPYSTLAATALFRRLDAALPPKSKPSRSSRSPQKPAGGPLRNVQEMLKQENMSTLSRGGQSRTRLEAYGRLTRAGMSTWDVRLDEKVSRVQDMRAFSDSMWSSFHDWNTHYQSVG